MSLQYLVAVSELLLLHILYHSFLDAWIRICMSVSKNFVSQLKSSHMHVTCLATVDHMTTSHTTRSPALTKCFARDDALVVTKADVFKVVARAELASFCVLSY